MHAWFKFACVVLAWILLPAVVILAGPGRPVHQVQVSTRTSSTSYTSARAAVEPSPAALTSLTAAVPAALASATTAPAATASAATASAATATLASAATAPTAGTATASPAAAPARTYAVQRGDTLSAIAARFGVGGGWPALYAANRAVIGPDPDALGVGTVLRLPVPAARYTVMAGDTLSAIAARFGVGGGWPALYAANRAVIGPDPDTLPAGIRLAIPSPATVPGGGSAPGSPAPGGTTPSGAVPGGTSPSGSLPGQPHTAPPCPASSPAPSAPPAARQHPSQPHVSSGMPSWLKTMLLAAGLVAVLVFAAEPVLLARRRRRRRGGIPAPPHPAGAAPQTISPPEGSVPEMPVMPVSAREDRLEPARIVMADHHRIVVTRSKRDDTICVLRPPGENPADILRVARLVLPEGHYAKLAEQLGMPANWPMNQ